MYYAYAYSWAFYVGFVLSQLSVDKHFAIKTRAVNQ